MRFYGLSDRPLHSDEAVHAHFTFELPDNRYTYDPIYHGPFLYHVTALSFALFGTSAFALRLPQVLFGIGLIALLWPLRKEQYLGKKGVIVSALLIALSPSLVYYSRFAIHESFFAFFTLGTVVFSALYFEGRNPLHLNLAAAMLALLFTAKENAYLVAAVFAVSALAAFGWKPQNLPRPRHLLPALLVFAFVFVFFYSSMFRNPGSLALGITAPVTTWLDKAQTWLGHQKPALYYASLLVIYELPLLLFGLAGVAASGPLTKRKNGFLRFASLWGLLTLAVYFLIKYKTPWQVVHMALPLALLAGAFVGRMGQKWWVVAIFAATLAFSTIAMARVNFEKSADPAEPLVYVQTSDDVSRLVKIVDGIALEKGEKPTISVISTDYWPLPFYFKDYGAGYWTGDAPAQIDADVVLSSTANEKKVEEILGSGYKKAGIFKLREWYGAGYTLDKLCKFLLDGSGYDSTGSFDLALYLRRPT